MRRAKPLHDQSVAGNPDAARMRRGALSADQGFLNHKLQQVGVLTFAGCWPHLPVERWNFDLD